MASTRPAGSSRSVVACWLATTCLLTLTLGGCGGGGSNPPPDNGPDALYFAYPTPGQQDIPVGAQIALVFPGPVPAATAQSALTLKDAAGNTVPVQIVVPGTPGVEDPPTLPPGGIVRLVPDAPLAPNTEYVVGLGQGLHAGDGNFAAGTILTRFTTRPAAGAPAAAGFTVLDHSPGGSDGLGYAVFTYTDEKTGSVVHFANTVHVTFSEDVDPVTVIAGGSFRFTDANGTEIPGKLFVQGDQLSFQPTAVLTAGQVYTVNLSNAVKSVTGDALIPNGRSTFTLKAVDSGPGTLREFLAISPDINQTPNLPPSTLTGLPTNSIDLVSGLIGSNVAYASDYHNPASDPNSGRIVAYLGQPAGTLGPGGPFYSVLPVMLPAGTQLAGSGLSLSLAGNANAPGVPAQLSTGDLHITVLNNANIYFRPNPLRADGLPVTVIMHLDLGLTGADPTGNGVLNQTILNVVAIGAGEPLDGKLFASAVSSFPIKIANTGTATANLNLQLVLPPPNPTANPDPTPDTTPPTLLAQSPSACFYAFGSGNGAPLNGSESQCSATGSTGAVTIDDVPVDGSPALTFSKPIDPSSLVNASGGHDAGHLQLADAGGAAVAFTARTSGSSVVLHPDQPLAPNTQYTITAGNGLTDLAGNALASAQVATFRTAPYVATPSAAAFITTLTPGLPCALAAGSGNFTTGGNTAGYCAGDSPRSGIGHQVFPVFQQPANRPIEAFFTKPVQTASIAPANGCLTAAAAGASAASSGSFALETIDSSGACTGVVAGGVVIPHPGATQTRSFDYVPQMPLSVGQRYWLVICGNSGSTCTTGQHITDVDGNILNTDPLNGSGSGSAGTSAGGSDLVMPFDATPEDDDYFIVLQALPEADSNGNGHFDGGENAESANRTVVSILGAPFTAYLAGDRPIEVEPATTDCGNAPISAIGTTPPTCAPFALFAGGMFDLTSIDIDLQSVIANITPSILDQLLGALGLPSSAGLNGLLSALGGSLSALPPLVSTGRVILRLQGGTDASGGTTATQTGYIVPECTGSINGAAYDYKPCIAVTLNLNANAPDGSGVSVPQQTISPTLVGSLGFLNNGRLIIDLRNTNTISLTANALGLLPLTANINPGDIHLQLAGYPVHGD